MNSRHLQAALETLWSPWSAVPFPPDAKFPLSADMVGAAFSAVIQSDGAPVPTFPPSHPDNRPSDTQSADWDAATLDEWSERAAILEHDGGLCRADAETQATAEIMASRGG